MYLYVDELYLMSSVTAPATTGDATLVPDKERQPPLKQYNCYINSLYTIWLIQHGNTERERIVSWKVINVLYIITG